MPKIDPESAVDISEAKLSIEESGGVDANLKNLSTEALSIEHYLGVLGHLGITWESALMSEFSDYASGKSH